MGAVLKFQKCLAFAQDALKTVSDTATSLAVEAQGVRDARGLTKAHKEELDQVIVYTLAALNPDTEVSNDLVYNLLKGDDAIFSTEKCKRIVALYQGEAAEVNTKEERFALMCNAFAAINADLLEDNDVGDTEELAGDSPSLDH